MYVGVWVDGADVYFAPIPSVDNPNPIAVKAYSSPYGGVDMVTTSPNNRYIAIKANQDVHVFDCETGRWGYHRTPSLAYIKVALSNDYLVLPNNSYHVRYRVPLSDLSAVPTPVDIIGPELWRHFYPSGGYTYTDNHTISLLYRSVRAMNNAIAWVSKADPVTGILQDTPFVATPSGFGSAKTQPAIGWVYGTTSAFFPSVCGFHADTNSLDLGYWGNNSAGAVCFDSQGRYIVHRRAAGGADAYEVATGDVFFIPGTESLYPSGFTSVILERPEGVIFVFSLRQSINGPAGVGAYNLTTRTTAHAAALTQATYSAVFAAKGATDTFYLIEDDFSNDRAEIQEASYSSMSITQANDLDHDYVLYEGIEHMTASVFIYKQVGASYESIGRTSDLTDAYDQYTKNLYTDTPANVIYRGPSLEVREERFISAGQLFYNRGSLALLPTDSVTPLPTVSDTAVISTHGAAVGMLIGRYTDHVSVVVPCEKSSGVGYARVMGVEYTDFSASVSDAAFFFAELYALSGSKSTLRPYSKHFVASTPVVYTHSHPTRLLVAQGPWLQFINPADGSLLWQVQLDSIPSCVVQVQDTRDEYLVVVDDQLTKINSVAETQTLVTTFAAPITPADDLIQLQTAPIVNALGTWAVIPSGESLLVVNITTGVVDTHAAPHEFSGWRWSGEFTWASETAVVLFFRRIDNSRVGYFYWSDITSAPTIAPNLLGIDHIDICYGYLVGAVKPCFGEVIVQPSGGTTQAIDVVAGTASLVTSGAEVGPAPPIKTDTGYITYGKDRTSFADSGVPTGAVQSRSLHIYYDGDIVVTIDEYRDRQEWVHSGALLARDNTSGTDPWTHGTATGELILSEATPVPRYDGRFDAVISGVLQDLDPSKVVVDAGPAVSYTPWFIWENHYLWYTGAALELAPIAGGASVSVGMVGFNPTTPPDIIIERPDTELVSGRITGDEGALVEVVLVNRAGPTTPITQGTYELWAPAGLVLAIPTDENFPPLAHEVSSV